MVLLVIGGVVSYRQRKSEDLFLGGRSMGWFNVGLSIFGTNIGPAFLIATCGAGYTSGMVTANFEWMAWVFLFLLGMVFLPFYLNTKMSTMPGWPMALTARASWMKRATASSCRATCGCSTLMATFLPMTGCTAA